MIEPWRTTLKNAFDLSRKVAIVTGASIGLGAGVMLGLAEASAAAIGIGSDLLDKKAFEEECYEILTERAHRLTINFQQAKEKFKK